MKRWACLNKQNEIIAKGITHGKFDRLCMNFSCLDFALWILGGKKYVEVQGFKGIEWGTPIDDVEHGPIKRSRAGVSFFGIR